MHDIIRIILEFTSDHVLFLTIQILLLLFVSVAFIIANIKKIKSGSRGSNLSVIRGETSMGKFYATYATITGLLVTICLSVDTFDKHKIFWILLDVTLVFYVCLYNTWFRNLLIKWSDKLTNLEKG